MRIGRLVGIWSAVEGVVIFVGVTVCQNIGAAHAIAPVIAIIVGLHFLPLARGILVPVYCGTALALVATGAGVLLWLPPSHQLPATGWLAAFILWVSCVELVSAPGRASVDR